MNLSQEELLFGRIALHYKLVNQEQLASAAAILTSEGGLRGLGEILVDQGVLQQAQLDQLRAVQRDYLAKQQGQPQAATPAVTAVPTSAAPSVAPSVAPPPPVAAAPAPAPPPPTAAAPSWRTAERPLQELLVQAVRQGASDIHVHCGATPKVRLQGTLEEVDSGILTADETGRWVRDVLTPDQIEALETRGQVDFAYTLPGVGRFRSNAYRQQREAMIDQRSNF